MNKLPISSYYRLLVIFVILPIVASHAIGAEKPAPDYSRIISQTYNPNQKVTETRLANGLLILTKESHSAPVTMLEVVYKVGSRDEVSGFTGLSHILEHMMFKGTTHLPAGAIDYLERQAGAYNNASTGEDRTEYHELFPSSRLEPMIKLEADRMVNSAFRPNDLASEMTVVRSELEGDTNDPDTDLFIYSLLPTAFTAHPYRWPAIGFTSDVEAVQHNRTVIYNYYKQHYMPNNATVVIVGDFKTSDAVAYCQKYFGLNPPGKLIYHHITPEPTQHGERRVILRRPGTTPDILLAFHEPGLATPDHYALDVISTILSGGVSSRLYQNLVEAGIATDANANDSDHKDPYLMVFESHPQDGVGIDKVETALEDEITKLQTAQVTQQELDSAINQIKAQFVYSRDSVSSQASTIGDYSALNTGYRYNDTYLGHIEKVTAAQIQDVAKRLFTADNRTVAIFQPTPLPPGKTLPPPPSGEHFGSRKNTGQQAAEFAKFATEYGLNKQKSAPTTAKPVLKVLPNGLTLIVQQNHSNTTVSIAGYIKAGTIFDTPDTEGLAALTAGMLNRGTTTKTALQLAQQLDQVGAGISVGAGLETADIGGACLTKDFPLTIATLGDELVNPTFPQDELDKLIKESYSGLERARQDTGGTGGAGELADIAFAQSLYPKGHPFWQADIDTQESILKATTRQQLLDFYGKYYRPDSTVLVVVGDVTPGQAEQVVEASLGGWKKPDSAAPVISIPDVPLPSEPIAPKLIAISSAPQTSIIFGFPGGLKRTDKDYYASNVANYILGGDIFGSRLGHQIRDVDGLSYTIWSHFDASLGAGSWSAFAGTNPSNVNKALAEIKQITSDYVKNGATAEELRQAKVYLTGQFPLRLETNSGVANLLSVAHLYNLGLDYPQRYVSIINSLTLQQVNAAAKAHLHPDNAIVIMSGATPK